MNRLFYLIGLDNLLSNLAPLPGIQGNYLIISRSHLTLTNVFVLFLKLFQVGFGRIWIKGVVSRILVRASQIDLNFGTQMENIILRKAHCIQ